MKKNKKIYCNIHGTHSKECPFCKELKEKIKNECSWCSYRIIEKECTNCGRKPC